MGPVQIRYKYVAGLEWAPDNKFYWKYEFDLCARLRMPKNEIGSRIRDPGTLYYIKRKWVTMVDVLEDENLSIITDENRFIVEIDYISHSQIIQKESL